MYSGYIAVSFSHGLYVPVDHNAARHSLGLPVRVREWEGECPHEPGEEWCGEEDSHVPDTHFHDFPLTRSYRNSLFEQDTDGFRWI